MSSSNPVQLPPGFEVRKLEQTHCTWAQALITHSNVFLSPFWSVVYPEKKVERAYKTFVGCDYVCSFSIDSGYSYGVFDTTYKFKNPESAAEDGKLYWDPKEVDTATEELLLKQMDFPLVSVALAYDPAVTPMDVSKMGPLIEALPLFSTMIGGLESLDPRDPEGRKPKTPKEVLYRSSTITRADYMGRKLSKCLAHWLMKEVAADGVQSIQIDTAHPAVDHVWMNPPAPFTSVRLATLDTAVYETEVDGKAVKPFVPCGILCTRVLATF